MHARNKATGARIIGTLDRLYVTASLVDDAFEREPDGSLKYDFMGESDVNWDSQETVEQDGKTVFVDDNGAEIPEDQVELYEPCHECDGRGIVKVGKSRTQDCPECKGTGVATAEGTEAADGAGDDAHV